jgi:hypothetical protein
MPVQLTQLIGVGIFWVVLGLLWVIKMLIDRQVYAKKADHNMLVFNWPKAGNVTNELYPIENIGGFDSIRYPRKGDISKWPIHRITDIDHRPIKWPLGKMAFVQTQVEVVSFEGDDVNPIPLGNRPPMSAKQLGSLIQGVTMAVDEALRNVRSESADGKIQKQNGLLWVYISLGVLGALSLTTLIIIINKTELISKIAQGITQLLQAKGLQ